MIKLPEKIKFDSIDFSGSFWTLPNILTFGRLALLPLIIVFMFIQTSWAAAVALTLFAVGALTDYLDGWAARKYNQISAFGTLMDPISDKIYVVTILIMLVATERLDSIFVLLAIIILVREFMVAGLREYLAPKGVEVPVSSLAKWKTASQMLALGLLIIGPYFFGGTLLGILALIGATGLTLYTGLDYMKAGFDHLREEAREHPDEHESHNL